RRHSRAIPWHQHISGTRDRSSEPYASVALLLPPAHVHIGGWDEMERGARRRARGGWRSDGVAPARSVESRKEVLDSVSRMRRRHHGGDLLGDSLQDAVECIAVLRRFLRARGHWVRD